MFFVSYPVLQDISGQPAGPIQGDVIFRDVDQQYLKQASANLVLPLNMTLYSSWQASSSKPGAYTSTDPSVYIHPLNGSYILGDDVVRDVSGHPAFVIGAILPRTMYQAGVTTLNFIDASLLVASVAFGAAMFLLMQTVVLSRLRKLDNDVKAIGGKGGATKLEVKGDDSISSLGRSINDMLGEIETKSTQLRESERYAAIGELATMVAHDLRNPLQGIANAAFYLKRSRSSSPKDEEMLTLIQDDVKYSDKIVSDLLDYSRSSTLELSETNPRLLMELTLPMIPLPKNVIVQDETQDGPTFKVDLDRMKRVIINIVNNAVDAMPNGGSLTLGSKENGKTVDLTFTDTGTGMTQEVLGKLFQPLLHHQGEGDGPRVVDMQTDSQRARRRYLRSEHARPRDDVHDYPADHQRRNEGNPGHSVRYIMSTNQRPLILIVDDDKTIRTSLAGILEQEGYDVDTAGDGAGGHQKIEREGLRPGACGHASARHAGNGTPRKAERKDP